MKIVYKTFSTYEGTSTSIKKTSILFGIEPYYDRLWSSGSTDTHFSDILVLSPEFFKSYVTAYNGHSDTILQMTNMDLTLLKFLEKLKQITSVFVTVVIGFIRPESYLKLFMETLGAALVGSRAVREKRYTVILNFFSLSNIDIDYHSTVNGYMIRLFEILAECLAQNRFVDHNIILEFELLNDTAFTFTRLTKDISISMLSHFQCTLEDRAQNLFSKVLSADVVDFLISTQKSLQYLEFGVNDHICTRFWVIKYALINNTTLQKLKICNGLFEFNRNHRTNEMELTRSALPIYHLNLLPQYQLSRFRVKL